MLVDCGIVFSCVEKKNNDPHECVRVPPSDNFFSFPFNVTVFSLLLLVEDASFDSIWMPIFFTIYKRKKTNTLAKFLTIFNRKGATCNSSICPCCRCVTTFRRNHFRPIPFKCFQKIGCEQKNSPEGLKLQQ